MFVAQGSQCGRWGGGRSSLAVVPALAHPWEHSQCILRITGSWTGSSKLSCFTVQVTFFRFIWLEGIKFKKLVTVNVPGRGPGTWLVFAFPSRDQEMLAGGRPPVERQRATGTGSWLSRRSGTSRIPALFWGWAGERKKRDRSLLN